MAFNPTTENLWLEVEASLKETDRHTESAMNLVRRYTGRWYTRYEDEHDPDPENFPFAFISNVLPQLAIDNPGVKITAARIIGHRTIAQAMDDGIQTVIDELDWSNLHMATLAEFCFVRGVSMHLIKEEARFNRGTVTPSVVRIPVTRFFQDSLAESADLDEFRGHWFYADIDDLQADERVNQEALNSISPGGEGDDGEDTNKRRKSFHRRSGSDLGRRRVKLYAIWLRQRNTIRVLAQGSKLVELYEETEYYGDPTGPYQLYDAYPVPGEAWPLSPLVACEDQNVDLNVHARAMGRSAARRKSIGLVEANNPDLGDKLTEAEDGEILPVKGITGQFVQIEVGGVSQQQYQITEYLRDRLDRMSGMTATIQGSVGTANTATEAQIADNALANRIRFLRNRVLDATSRSLNKVGWYLFHTEGIVIPVNRMDPYSGEQLEGVFLGGPFPTDDGAVWDDFDLRVLPFTMQRESQSAEQARVLGYWSVFQQAIMFAMQVPGLRIMTLLRDLGRPFDMEDKAEEWLFAEAFGSFGQPPQLPVSQVMGAAQPPQQQPGLPLLAPGGYQQQQQDRGMSFGDPTNGGTANGSARGPRLEKGENSFAGRT